MIQEKKKRSAYFDNIKGVLIILVVFGHCLFDVQEYEIINNIVDTIYLFHMPAFIFITGYLSKSPHCRSKEALQRLFCAYVIFNTLMMLCHSFVSDTLFSLMSPYNSCWYLLAVIVWRMVSDDISKMPKSLLYSVIVAFAIGLFQDVTNVLAAARIVAFYPFFLAGYKFDSRKMTAFYENRKPKHYFAGVLALFMVLFFSLCFIHLFQPSDATLQMFAYTKSWEILLRGLIFFISALAILGLFLCLPNRNVRILTKAGQNSLSIFLLHRIITLIVSEWMQTLNNEYYLILISIAETIIIVVLCETDMISGMVAKGIDTFYSLFNSKNKNKKTSRLIAKMCVLVVFIFIIVTQFLVRL